MLQQTFISPDFTLVCRGEIIPEDPGTSRETWWNMAGIETGWWICCQQHGSHHFFFRGDFPAGWIHKGKLFFVFQNRASCSNKTIISSQVLKHFWKDGKHESGSADCSGALRCCSLLFHTFIYRISCLAVITPWLVIALWFSITVLFSNWILSILPHPDQHHTGGSGSVWDQRWKPSLSPPEPDCGFHRCRVNHPSIQPPSSYPPALPHMEEMATVLSPAVKGADLMNFSWLWYCPALLYGSIFSSLASCSVIKLHYSIGSNIFSVCTLQALIFRLSRPPHLFVEDVVLPWVAWSLMDHLEGLPGFVSLNISLAARWLLSAAASTAVCSGGTIKVCRTVDSEVDID